MSALERALSIALATALFALVIMNVLYLREAHINERNRIAAEAALMNGECVVPEGVEVCW